MKSILKLIGLVTVFSTAVSCCSRIIPPIGIYRDIPIEPAAVLFIVGSNSILETSVSGSGIIVESSETESWALSAGHVCYPETEDPFITMIDVWTTMGISFVGEIAPMKIVALDQLTDTCVLRISIGNLPVAPLASKMPNIGERVFLGAYPMGIYQPGHVPFFEGYYAGILDGKASYTIPVTGGSSGGGVINSKGEVVGVVSMAIEGFENITLVAKLENIQSLLDAAKKNPDRLTILR